MIYSPGTSDITATAAPPPATPPAEVTPPAAPAPDQATASLAEQIRADREARAARAAREAEEADYKAKLTAAEAKIAELSKTGDVARRDIVAHLTALGFTEKDLATAGETIMYHLVPDQAPQDVRIRALEARMDRERREAEEAEKRRAQEAEKRRAQEAEQEAERLRTEYVTALRTAAESAATAGLINSAAWFADNHDDYTESLLRTAQNLASSAQAAGKVADLSPANVAAVLEKHLSERAARIKTTGAAAPVPATAPAKSLGAPAPLPQAPTPAPSAPSAPTQKPLTDRERLARAVAVAFKN